jgi:hypothetical protein
LDGPRSDRNESCWLEGQDLFKQVRGGPGDIGIFEVYRSEAAAQGFYEPGVVGVLSPFHNE